MPETARGLFDVQVIPQPASDPAAGAFARFLLDKRFHGDLEATSKGEMLAAGDPATGQGGYVALERVAGTLHGRSGSFALQHRGVMSGGDYTLNVTVVPGSGTEGLAGLAGEMKIIIEGKTHRYEFESTLGRK